MSGVGESRPIQQELIAGQSDGMIKLVWDPDNGRVLGGSIVGYRASEVITTVALAVKAQLTVDTLATAATRLLAFYLVYAKPVKIGAEPEAQQ